MTQQKAYFTFFHCFTLHPPPDIQTDIKLAKEDSMSTNNFSDPPPTTPPLTHSEYSASSTRGSPLPYDLQQQLELDIGMGDHTYMKARTISVHDGLLPDASLTEADTAPPTSAYDMQAYTTVSWTGLPLSFPLPHRQW